MRRTRWLFLAAIVAVIFAVSVSFIRRRDIRDHEVSVHPKPLESGVDARSNDWVHTEFKGDKKHYTVRARNFREIKEPSVVELEGVELQESASGGGSDGNFTAALGRPTLDGLGAVGEGAHAAHESILINRIADRTALLAKLVAAL